jgi:predicted dehydrogenase
MSDRSRTDVYIVGAGVIAGHHARAIPSDAARLAGVIEVDADRRSAFVEAHPGIESYSSLDAFLSQSRRGDALVVVATPPPHHYAICCALLDEGLHVLCEKPLAPTLAEARDLAERARARGVQAGSCESRFLGFDPVRRASEIVASGAIGAVRHVEQKSTRRLFRNGIEYQPGSQWFLNKRLSGGGPVLDWGVYDVAVVDAVVGGLESSSVRYAKLLGELAPVPEPQRDLYDVEEYAFVVSDASTRCGGVYSFVHERGAVVHGREEHYLRVIGMNGGLEIGWLPGDSYLTEYTFDSHGSPTAIEHEVDDSYDVHALPIRDMVGAIRTGRDPLVTFGRASVHISYVDAVYAASGYYAGEGQHV